MRKQGKMFCNNKRYVMVVATVTVGLLLLGAVGFGRGSSESPDERPQFRLLLIDETKTFASTMRVGALAGIIKETGMFDLMVKLVDVDSSFDDSLGGAMLEPAQDPYDLILILPRGLDNGSVKQIWLVSDGLNGMALHVRAGVDVISQIVNQVFQGIGQAIDVSEDLYPGLLSALYIKGGWLR